MNPLPPNPESATLSRHSIRVLGHIASSRTNGCLIVSSQSVEWRFYFYQGQLTYGTHSVEPFERLERHLSVLSKQNPLLTSTVRSQARNLFAQTNAATRSSYQTADCQAIAWLIRQKYLKNSEITLLAKSLLEEVLESYLLLDIINYKIVPQSAFALALFDSNLMVKDCQKRLNGWQKLVNKINSPYQKLYLVEQENTTKSLPLAQREKLKKILIGFNFRQLACLVNQNALTLAQNLYPLIVKGAIDIREPQAPFDQLPKIPRVFTQPQTQVRQVSTPTSPRETTANSVSIVCVDDSPAMLKAIKHFLRNQDVEVFTVTDPLKALLEIIRLKPKLIFLDISMPNLDGHHLSRLIRKHFLFQQTPIVMVTGNTGILDRAKARVSGATHYLTKPFSQGELETIVKRYLSN